MLQFHPCHILITLKNVYMKNVTFLKEIDDNNAHPGECVFAFMYKLNVVINSELNISIVATHKSELLTTNNRTNFSTNHY